MIAQGRVPYHEHDDADIREALAMALGERNKALYRRLLAIFVIIVLVGAFMLQGVTNAQHQSDRDRVHFERASRANCQANRDNTIGFNRFIDKLEASYAHSPVLTPKQRRQRSAFFDTAKQRVPTCPPAALVGTGHARPWWRLR